MITWLMEHQTMVMVGQTIPLGRDLDPTMGKADPCLTTEELETLTGL